jgi:hypothetical protein
MMQHAPSIAWLLTADGDESSPLLLGLLTRASAYCRPDNPTKAIAAAAMCDERILPLLFLFSNPYCQDPISPGPCFSVQGEKIRVGR